MRTIAQDLARKLLLENTETSRPPSFGASSYYFGANIPGKPRKYLLNAAGRPKFFAVIADVRASNYQAFRLSTSTESEAAPR